jgi:hypothetical protein
MTPSVMWTPCVHIFYILCLNKIVLLHSLNFIFKFPFISHLSLFNTSFIQQILEYEGNMMYKTCYNWFVHSHTFFVCSLWLEIATEIRRKVEILKLYTTTVLQRKTDKIISIVFCLLFISISITCYLHVIYKVHMPLMDSTLKKIIFCINI